MKEAETEVRDTSITVLSWCDSDFQSGPLLAPQYDRRLESTCSISHFPPVDARTTSVDVSVKVSVINDVKPMTNEHA